MAELDLFVREALSQQKSREGIREALLEAGWRPDEITKALNRYAEVDFSIPVPRPRLYLPARDAFLYLVMFAAMYASALGVGTVLFRFIHGAFPDPVQEEMYYYVDPLEGLRWSVASVIIAYPIYMAIAVSLHRAYATDPERRGSRVRKWLTYITLFIATSVIIGDLTALVFRLLDGEVTVRFLFKVLVVGVLAGLIFGYYLWDLRRDEREK